MTDDIARHREQKAQAGQEAQRLRTERLAELDRRTAFPAAVRDHVLTATLRAFSGYWDGVPDPAGAFELFRTGEMAFVLSVDGLRVVVANDGEPPEDVPVGFYL